MANFKTFQALHKRILDAGGKIVRYVFDNGTGECTYRSHLGTTDIKITEFQDTDTERVKRYTELVDKFIDYQKNHERDFLEQRCRNEMQQKTKEDLTKEINHGEYY